MRVQIVLELEVGVTPVADAITYLIGNHGIAPGDGELTPEGWVEAVVVDSFQRILDRNHSTNSSGWVLLSTTVSNSD